MLERQCSWWELKRNKGHGRSLDYMQVWARGLGHSRHSLTSSLHVATGGAAYRKVVDPPLSVTASSTTASTVPELAWIQRHAVCN